MSRERAVSPPVDGRSLRSERSRGAMVDALFELIGEGVAKPTAQQIAKRAGVGIRSVFRHFEDMDTLFAQVDSRLRSVVIPLLVVSPPAGGPEMRARGLVLQRAAVFERIAPYRRSANINRHRSHFVQMAHQSFVRELRADLRRWLPELDGAPADLADAVELATSFEVWDRLRSDQRLGVDRARAAMERTVVSLVRELRA